MLLLALAANWGYVIDVAAIDRCWSGGTERGRIEGNQDRRMKQLRESEGNKGLRGAKPITQTPPFVNISRGSRTPQRRSPTSRCRAAAVPRAGRSLRNGKQDFAGRWIAFNQDPSRPRPRLLPFSAFLWRHPASASPIEVLPSASSRCFPGCVRRREIRLARERRSMRSST